MPVKVNRECICCGACAEVCPQGIMRPAAVTNNGSKAYRQYICWADDECLGCGACAEACDQGAITVTEG